MSFEELVKKLSPTLKRITYKLNGHFTFFNEDDLFQEAIIHLWMDFKKGKLGDKTDSYILQGCFYHLKNYIRKARDKAQLVSIDALTIQEGADLDLEEILCLDSPETCFEYLDAKMLSERIQDWGLTSRENDVLFLYMDGLTVREIGKRLKISHVMVVKVKNKIRVKCEKFRKEIAQGYQDQ